MRVKSKYINSTKGTSSKRLEWRILYTTTWNPFLRVYLWWSLCTLYELVWQVTVTVDDSGLCCWELGLNYFDGRFIFSEGDSTNEQLIVQTRAYIV